MQNWNEQLKESVLQSARENILFNEDLVVSDNAQDHHSGACRLEEILQKNPKDKKNKGAKVRFCDGCKRVYNLRELFPLDSVKKKEFDNLSLTPMIIEEISKNHGIDKRILGACLSFEIINPDDIPENERRALYKISKIKALKPNFALPKFNGKETRINGKLHKIGYLCGEFGERFFEEYEYIAGRYENISPECKQLHHDSGIISGSNVVSCILANEILQPFGLRTVSIKDAENVMNYDRKNFLGKDVHLGLALRTRCGFYPSITNRMAEQIKRKEGKIQFPYYIDFKSIRLLDKLSDEEYPLFELRENSYVVYAPQLSEENNNKFFSHFDENGFPVFNPEGHIPFYATPFGIALIRIHPNYLVSSEGTDLFSTEKENCMIIISEE